MSETAGSSGLDYQTPYLRFAFGVSLTFGYCIHNIGGGNRDNKKLASN